MTQDPSHAGHSRFDFGPLAARYDAWYRTPVGQAHDRVQKQDVSGLLRAGRAGERLLDVGCGTGHWSRYFAARGYRVTGVDIAPEMIAAAGAAASDGEFLVADALDLPFEDGAFDVAASMTVLEFVSEPASLLREMARCTRPGGTLLIGTLNRLAPINRQRLRELRRPYASGRLLSPGELTELLRPFGRVEIAATPVAEKPRPSAPARFLRRCLGRRRQRLTGALMVAAVHTP